MKLNIETFTKVYLPQAVKDKQCLPSSGEACALASVRYIRDEMLKEVADDDKPIVLDFFNGETGLLAEIQIAKTLNGFCCNASAAAKAAGLEKSNAVLKKLVE